MLSLTNILTLLTVATSALATPLQPREKKLAFHLHDINYSSSMVYSTPAHLATYGGTIAFNLSNAAVPYVTKCSAYGMHLQDMFYGEIVYTCDAPAGSTGVTSFTYSRPGNEFQVNQTWTGYDGKSYFGRGSGTADLKCKSVYWQNSNWTMGQLYSTTTVTCEPAQLTILPTVIET
ncbi:uncharacterized protein BDR25DRAFT_304672 [Lindgomyces ingoldianus]|uniref:Uncharacterized protein n=1 Tax=Lindgomyces ingoldianus TaxID=673940 RepID=A0ACB6QQM3_9PLEO|nr:uncharacterized protein BDR25DRAFT_304672 [Lindgomyces ingoldianus]KAF2469185.1 hypothetical protein BDR25DRAFT_304672 [Lindgomyces ingoldianus]